jgi:hypothetical protein
MQSAITEGKQWTVYFKQKKLQAAQGRSCRNDCHSSGIRACPVGGAWDGPPFNIRPLSHNGESMKRVIGILSVLLVLLWTTIMVSSVASSQASKQAFVQLPLDCHQSRIQSGVPVRRLSDGKITRIDVCGAADSADDSFRNIPYELPQGYPRN